MKLNDAVWGALLALLGAAILWHVQGFPRIPGQNVGPALFPGILAAGLVVCGTAADRERAEGARADRGDAVALGGRARVAALAAAPARVRGPGRRATSSTSSRSIASASCSPRFVYLAALMWALRVRLAVALPVALVMALLIHYAFYKLLRVPLPWGVLQGVAW